MKQLVQRPYQEAMTRFLIENPRCNLFASPGTGKTSSTLMALSGLSMAGCDVFPALVAAPLRVANLVWQDEVETWAQFQGLRVARVTGSAAQREAALRQTADIYTVNYENAAWLQAQHRIRPRTIVADESRKLAAARTHYRQTKSGKWSLWRGGTKNASALSVMAPHAERWINLTGTPTPNGIKDLWGQQWPIDFGRSLGRTHAAFMSRWFRPAASSKPEQRQYVPMPHAFEEITQRIKPVTKVVDAYDHFDIERPVEVPMHIDLPDKLRSQYARLHKDSVLELGDMGLVKGVNAGAKIMKCRQFAAGHIVGDTGEWLRVHDLKLRALSELRDKLDGAPLMVAYHFTEDARRIVEANPDAVRLPANFAQQRKVMSDWNEGRIPMLVVHPQSAGHGLSLQHGGNHLCFYTPDWDLECHDQVIERIGPTRQAQSGYKRLVYIYRLLVRGTWDQPITHRLVAKSSVQDAVKLALTSAQ